MNIIFENMTKGSQCIGFGIVYDYELKQIEIGLIFLLIVIKFKKK